jgi:nicotinamidase-related amidase
MAAKTPEPPILLLIDLQHGLVEGSPEWGPRSTPDLVSNVTHLLSTWRSKGWPILHVHHDDIDDPTNPISSNFPETVKPHESAAPEGDEKVFVKHAGSPFVATKLPDAIKSYGHRKIVVIGMDGGQCVNSTTRHGIDLGYDMVVVGDACASMCSLGFVIFVEPSNEQDEVDNRHILTQGCRLWNAGLEATCPERQCRGYP